MRSSAHFHAALKELPKMLLWIRNHLIDAGMDAASIQKIELASEEAIVNIILHAYQEKGGRIDLTMAGRPDGVELIISDYGPPFNPLEAPPPDLTSSIEERKEGGLGIFFIRECADEVLYRREKEANCLVFFKRFSRKK